MPEFLSLAADATLYVSGGAYVSVLPTWLGVIAPPSGSAGWCGASAMRYCDQQSQAASAACVAVDCESLCDPRWPSRLCSGCFEQRDHCKNAVLQNFASCGACPSGTNCTTDVGQQAGLAGYSRCCPPGQFPCNGECRSSTCGYREEYSTYSCRCECVEPYVRSASGACVCPPADPCPPNSPLRGADCVCRPCPPGSTGCNGQCRVLTNDRANCGACGNVCAPGEDCCGGVCTPLFTNGRCGSCARDCVGANHACCGPDKNEGCRNLDSDLMHCGACGNPCSDFFGMVCVHGQCVCKAGYSPCGSGCCGPGWACDPSTKAGSSFCSCSMSRVCGPNDETCCAVGQTCCGEICCPVGQTCCNGQCVTLGTTVHCASCNDRCFYYTPDSASPNLGQCDPQRRCRCPPGTIVVALDTNGGDLECCPVSTPEPCADGFCRVQC